MMAETLSHLTAHAVQPISLFSFGVEPPAAAPEPKDDPASSAKTPSTTSRSKTKNGKDGRGRKRRKVGEGKTSLRGATLCDLHEYDNDSEVHIGDDTYQKTCKACGFVLQYEKL